MHWKSCDDLVVLSGKLRTLKDRLSALVLWDQPPYLHRMPYGCTAAHTIRNRNGEAVGTNAPELVLSLNCSRETPGGHRKSWISLLLKIFLPG